MNPGMASDEVTDAIAHIEMHRQGTEKEAGLEVACNEALRKLYQLLEQEQAAAQPQEAGAAPLANVEAVMIEIKRVKKLAGVASQGAILKRNHSGRRQSPPRPGRPRNVPRNKGRRTMGRRGER